MLNIQDISPNSLAGGMGCSESRMFGRWGWIFVVGVVGVEPENGRDRCWMQNRLLMWRFLR